MFSDRVEAGRQLARTLGSTRRAHPGRDDIVVVGLPRGGVPVAAEVASALGAPLDVIIVRKLGVPYQPELAMGALGEGGVVVLNDDVIRHARVEASELAAVESREQEELDRRVRQLRGEQPPVPLIGKVVVVVDDGIATGSTARAACQVARAAGASRIILAVPVAPAGWTERLAGVADEYLCVEAPASFRAVGQFYADFRPTTDDQVAECLRRRHDPVAPVHRDEEVLIEAGPVSLPGRLVMPVASRGVVAFAHGSGSSRHSPRNQYVASVLNHARIGTLLFDLLTRDEEGDRANVFDIDLLGRRLVAVTAWLQRHSSTRGSPVGYFGASTGAGAALWAASEPGVDIAAVVSRGGRPDLAGGRLGLVHAPTLLIVGGNDPAVLELNQQAASAMSGVVALDIVPGATHLFSEPGALEAVAGLARDWFAAHLVADPDEGVGRPR
ncbi:MAG: phosphoribosyltransferase family protein [Acidimicrobiia bacterium]|nr:phosphoribosyltransferase family protein [Acidimicrobiia bacterium]